MYWKTERTKFEKLITGLMCLQSQSRVKISSVVTWEMGEGEKKPYSFTKLIYIVKYQ